MYVILQKISFVRFCSYVYFVRSIRLHWKLYADEHASYIHLVGFLSLPFFLFRSHQMLHYDMLSIMYGCAWIDEDMLMLLIYCPCSICSHASPIFDKKNIFHFRCLLDHFQKIFCVKVNACVNAVALGRNCLILFVFSFFFVLTVGLQLRSYISKLKSVSFYPHILSVYAETIVQISCIEEYSIIKLVSIPMVIAITIATIPTNKQKMSSDWRNKIKYWIS